MHMRWPGALAFTLETAVRQHHLPLTRSHFNSDVWVKRAAPTAAAVTLAPDIAALASRLPRRRRQLQVLARSHQARGARGVVIGDGRSDFCMSAAADYVIAKGALARHRRASGGRSRLSPISARLPPTSASFLQQPIAPQPSL